MSIADLLRNELQHCASFGVVVNLVPAATVQLGLNHTSGWFDEKKGLSVAINRPLVDWLSVFVHESCHKDQFIEYAIEWDTKIDGVDAGDILDSWLAHDIQLADSALLSVIRKLQRVELDCERRSVRKILDNALPIDIGTYIKKANAYVWFYQAMISTRRWVTAVYDNPLLLELMPNHFSNDYETLPAGYLEIIQEMS